MDRLSASMFSSAVDFLAPRSPASLPSLVEEEEDDRSGQEPPQPRQGTEILLPPAAATHISSTDTLASIAQQTAELQRTLQSLLDAQSAGLLSGLGGGGGGDKGRRGRRGGNKTATTSWGRSTIGGFTAPGRSPRSSPASATSATRRDRRSFSPSAIPPPIVSPTLSSSPASSSAVIRTPSLLRSPPPPPPRSGSTVRSTSLRLADSTGILEDNVTENISDNNDGLSSARAGIYKALTSLAGLKRTERAALSAQNASLSSFLARVDSLATKRSRLRDRVSELETAANAPEESDVRLRSEEEGLSAEIVRLERRLEDARTRLRAVRAAREVRQNKREARLSSWRGALRDVDGAIERDVLEGRGVEEAVLRAARERHKMSKGKSDIGKRNTGNAPPRQQQQQHHGHERRSTSRVSSLLWRQVSNGDGDATATEQRDIHTGDDLLEHEDGLREGEEESINEGRLEGEEEEPDGLVWALPRSRRTLELVREDVSARISRASRLEISADAEAQACTAGAALWNDLVVRHVRRVERRLKTELSRISQHQHPRSQHQHQSSLFEQDDDRSHTPTTTTTYENSSVVSASEDGRGRESEASGRRSRSSGPQSIVAAMDEAIPALKKALGTCVENKWRPLECAVGAELEALRAARTVLGSMLESVDLDAGDATSSTTGLNGLVPAAAAAAPAAPAATRQNGGIAGIASPGPASEPEEPELPSMSGLRKPLDGISSSSSRKLDSRDFVSPELRAHEPRSATFPSRVEGPAGGSSGSVGRAYGRFWADGTSDDGTGYAAGSNRRATSSSPRPPRRAAAATGGGAAAGDTEQLLDFRSDESDRWYEAQSPIRPMARESAGLSSSPLQHPTAAEREGDGEEDDDDDDGPSPELLISRG